MKKHFDTSNDETIARAIAAADQEELDARLARRMDDGPFTYPGQRRDQIPRGRVVGVDTRMPQQQPMPSPNSGLPFPQMMMPRPRVAMCHVPCVVGDHVCVEMMVDTGAESSVISFGLAKELGLENKIDRREQGVALGVGQAKILGRIRDVICTLGHVEFSMEYIVLDMPGRLLLLGMDQMRKYKCIIDLQRDMLIFGGNGGVEVAMLPPEQQVALPIPGIGGSCTIS